MGRLTLKICCCPPPRRAVAYLPFVVTYLKRLSTFLPLLGRFFARLEKTLGGGVAHDDMRKIQALGAQKKGPACLPLPLARHVCCSACQINPTHPVVVTLRCVARYPPDKLTSCFLRISNTIISSHVLRLFIASTAQINHCRLYLMGWIPLLFLLPSRRRPDSTRERPVSHFGQTQT